MVAPEIPAQGFCLHLSPLMLQLQVIPKVSKGYSSCSLGLVADLGRDLC